MDVELHVINLDRATDRWKQLEASMQAFPSYHVRRFSAMEGKSLTPAEIKGLVSPRAFYILQRGFRLCHEDFTTLGAIGCYMSHVALWKECVKQNKPFFILEDDFEMDARMDALFQETHPLLPTLGLVLLKPIEIRGNKTTPYNSTFDSFQGLFFGLMAYGITPSMARQLVAHAFPIDCQLDAYVGQMSVRNDFPIYVVSGQLGIKGSAKSYIQNIFDCFSCYLPGVGYGHSKTANAIMNVGPYVALGVLLILLIVLMVLLWNK